MDVFLLMEIKLSLLVEVVLYWLINVKLKKIRYLINQSKDDTLYYKHHNLGFNMNMTNLHGSIGLSQLKKKLDEIIKTKKKNKSLLQKKRSKNQWIENY